MDAYSLPIHLLRQWAFCPRIPFYQELLGLRPKIPPWVDQGSQFDAREKELMGRRSLARYGLDEAEVLRDVKLHNTHYSMHGIVDLIIRNAQGVIPVEIKRRLPKNPRGVKLQLCGYAILGELEFGVRISHGYILYDSSKIMRVDFDEELRKKTLQARDAILKIITSTLKPSSGAGVAQCEQCEYLNYCNDRF